jgi:hypothetical protein
MAINLITSVNPQGGALSTGPQGQSVTGPLGDLNSSSFNYNVYKYPLTAQNSNPDVGHNIIFYINIPRESFWNTPTSTGSNGPAPVANRLSQASNFALRPDTPAGINPILGAAGLTGNPIGTNESPTTSLVLQSYTTRTTDAISLYIPNTMVWSHTAQYDSVSLSEALGLVGDSAASLLSWAQGNIKGAVSAGAKAMSDLLPSFVTNSLGSNVREALNQGLGIADNPQNFLLFKQIDFRKFNFEFILTPESQQEAQLINQIIYLFRFHSVPEVASGTTGRFFVPPSQFDIDILHNGAVNTYIPHINTCVLTNMTVDYGASGHWVTHVDGMPNQVIMNLSFTEMAILTKDLVQNGF